MDDDDRELGALLRAHAERMTEDLTDSSLAYAAVASRARARRGRRTAVIGGLAAAAAAAGVLVVASATGDRATVLTPATSPTAPSTPAVAPTIAPTTSVPTTVPTTVPAVPPTFPATTVPVQPVPPATAPATTAPSAATETYDGIGGSITVRLSGGVVTLVGDPSPTPGYATRVDDNGPDRVRVRFERDDARTEIRVEVEGGELVEEIIED